MNAEDEIEDDEETACQTKTSDKEGRENDINKTGDSGDQIDKETILYTNRRQEEFGDTNDIKRASYSEEDAELVDREGRQAKDIAAKKGYDIITEKGTFVKEMDKMGKDWNNKDSVISSGGHSQEDHDIILDKFLGSTEGPLAISSPVGGSSGKDQDSGVYTAEDLFRDMLVKQGKGRSDISAPERFCSDANERNTSLSWLLEDSFIRQRETSGGANLTSISTYLFTSKENLQNLVLVNARQLCVD